MDGQYEIAEIMGWEEEYVHKIIRRYVGRNGGDDRQAVAGTKDEQNLQNR